MIVELGNRAITLTDEQLKLFNALTSKLQRAVALASLAGTSLTDAHRDAGGKSRNEANRHKRVSQMRTNADVSAFLNSFKTSPSPQIASAVATREDILRDLTDISNVLISDVMSFTERPLLDMENGMQVLTSSIYVKSMDEIPPGAMKAIKGVKQTKHGIELILHDVIAVRKQIADMCGYDAPKRTEISGPGGEPIQLQEIPDEELEAKLKSLGLGRYHNQLSSKIVK